MISNITETCVMFNKPSYSISSDGHTENDDGPQTKTATVAAVAAVAEAHSGKQVHRGNSREAKRGSQRVAGAQSGNQVRRGSTHKKRFPGRFPGA